MTNYEYMLIGSDNEKVSAEEFEEFMEETPEEEADNVYYYFTGNHRWEKREMINM